VCPSTSKDPLASIAPVNVETPLTIRFERFACPPDPPPPVTLRVVAVKIPVTI